MSARAPTLREKQIARLAEAAGISYQAMLHLVQMLKPLGPPYAVAFGRGARGASLSLEQMFSLLFAAAVGPSMATEAVPLLAKATEIERWLDGPRLPRSRVGQIVLHPKGTEERGRDDNELAHIKFFEDTAAEWHLPGADMMSGLANWVNEWFVGPDAEKTAKYWRKGGIERIELRIFVTPVLGLEILQRWPGIDFRIRYAPPSLPQHHVKTGIRTERVIPFSLIEVVAALWRETQPAIQPQTILEPAAVGASSPPAGSA